MSLIGKNNEEKIWNYLKAQGLSDAGAAGLMGNLYAESGLRPNNLQNTYEGKLGMGDEEYTDLVDHGVYKNFVHDSAGYGLAQWTYWSRKQALLNYVKASNKSIGDLEVQLSFLIKELMDYKLFSPLKTSTSVRDASNLILLQFEKPASKDSKATQDKRAEYSQVYFNKYASQSTTETRKEVSSLKIVESILTKNPCYTAGRKITVKGLMLHSVGCSQPNASVFVKNWNSASFSNACVHGFIDANDGVVYQTLPWNHRGWHAGGSANNTHIGVEMCEPACIKYTSGSGFTCSDKATAQACVKRAYDSAVALFAMLCKQFALDPMMDGVIISHKEGCARGIASNHGDPEHLWTQLGMPYTMTGFRKDVKSAMGLATASTSSSTVSTFKAYTVRVKASALNVRTGAGTGYPANGTVKVGTVCTIVNEANGAGATKWGKLDNGNGWISLDYCEKLASESDQAIDKLVKLGVINSSDYWKKNINKVKYLDVLLIKAAKKITGKGARMPSPQVGIDQLVKDGIISSPDYWMAHYSDCANLDALLCALGGAKKD